MKKLFLSLIVVLFAFSAVGQVKIPSGPPVQTREYDFTDGNWGYEIIEGTENEVRIFAVSPSAVPSIVTLPSTVVYGGIEYTVTQLGSRAFTLANVGTSSIEELTVPNTIVKICDMAFEYVSLGKVIFGTGVRELGGNIFSGTSGEREMVFTSPQCPEISSCLSKRAENPTTYGCTFSDLTQLPYPFNNIPVTIHVPDVEEYQPIIAEFDENNLTLNPTVTYTSAPNVENANFEDASTWGVTSIQGTNRTFHIAEGHQVTLNSELVLNENTTLINDGVLKIAQGGELIIATDNNAKASVTQNDLGIVEVSTDVLPNDKWSFIGAPFAGYKLGAILPGTHDISISMFNYGNCTWEDDFATINTEVGAGEGFFAWSWAEEATVFTTYGDVWDYENNQIGEYNPNQDPAYSINSTDVDVTKELVPNNGNWMALANPYTFKLDIAKFIADQNDSIQGEVFYKLDDYNVWQTATTGAINLTEGFFVNFVNAGSQTAHFKTTQRYTSSAKASVEREFVRLAMLEGEREIELLFAHNEEANENYDIFDANKLFSPVEIAEPYFVTNNIALVKEEVNTLPYYATMNVRSFGNKEVKFKANYIPEGLSVSIIDGEETIDLAEGVEYTTNIVAGENADRFKVLIKKSLSLEEAEELQVNIFNNNRHINIETLESDIQVEVYNALGQKVFTTRDHNFALNNVPAGAYLIKAFNANASKTAKVYCKVTE